MEILKLLAFAPAALLIWLIAKDARRNNWYRRDSPEVPAATDFGPDED